MEEAYGLFHVCLFDADMLLLIAVIAIPSLADSVSGTRLKLTAIKLG